MSRGGGITLDPDELPATVDSSDTLSNDSASSTAAELVSGGRGAFPDYRSMPMENIDSRSWRE